MFNIWTVFPGCIRCRINQENYGLVLFYTKTGCKWQWLLCEDSFVAKARLWGYQFLTRDGKRDASDATTNAIFPLMCWLYSHFCSFGLSKSTWNLVLVFYSICSFRVPEFWYFLRTQYWLYGSTQFNTAASFSVLPRHLFNVGRVFNKRSVSMFTCS